MIPETHSHGFQKQATHALVAGVVAMLFYRSGYLTYDDFRHGVDHADNIHACGECDYGGACGYGCRMYGSAGHIIYGDGDIDGRNDFNTRGYCTYGEIAAHGGIDA